MVGFTYRLCSVCASQSSSLGVRPRVVIGECGRHLDPVWPLTGLDLGEISGYEMLKLWLLAPSDTDMVHLPYGIPAVLPLSLAECLLDQIAVRKSEVSRLPLLSKGGYFFWPRRGQLFPDRGR